MNDTLDFSPSAELFHYGVKGMRWGVRRSREELDRAAGRTTRAVRATGRAAAKTGRAAVNATKKGAKAYKDRRNARQVSEDRTSTDRRKKVGKAFVIAALAGLTIAGVASHNNTRQGEKMVEELLKGSFRYKMDPNGPWITTIPETSWKQAIEYLQ